MNKHGLTIPQGAGLGLRDDFVEDMQNDFPGQVNFLEVAPENYMHLGGAEGKQFRWFTERYPFITHGLTLNAGGSAPLDEAFIRDVKKFLDLHNISLYTDHISFSGDDGNMFDLFPIPFTEEAIKHTAARIRRTQDILERSIGVENVSYYAAPGKEMEEIDFINAVLEEADCLLLLDVNNIYVNSVNHHFDAKEFLLQLPKERVAYIHVAGHYHAEEDLIIDSHGKDVIDPVWDLLATAYEHFSVFPTLLERDNNIPALNELVKEIDIIHKLQNQAQQAQAKQDVSTSVVY